MEVIHGMCLTMRHDFGLEKGPDDVVSSGMTQAERGALVSEMSQLYDHHVAPAAAEAARKERALCAEICLKMARGQGDVDRLSVAYQLYLILMGPAPRGSRDAPPE